MAKSYKTLFEGIQGVRESLVPLESHVKSLKAGEILDPNPLSRDLDSLCTPHEAYEWVIVQSREKELKRQLRQIDIAIDKINIAARLIKLEGKIVKKTGSAAFHACYGDDQRALQILFTQATKLGQDIKDYTPNLTKAVEKFRDEFRGVGTVDETDYSNKSMTWILKRIHEARMKFVELGLEGLQIKADKVLQYNQQASMLREATLRGLFAANDGWAELATEKRIADSDKMTKDLFSGAVTLKFLLVSFNVMPMPSDKPGVRLVPKVPISASILPFTQNPA